MDREGRLVAGFAAARIAYAAALIAAPRRFGGPWLGEAAAQGGGRVAARALVARDALIAAGAGASALHGAAVRPWLAACVAADIADIGATLADRGALPPKSAPGTVALAGAAAAAGAALYVAVGS